MEYGSSVPEPIASVAPRPRDPRRAQFEANKLAKRLQRQVGEAIADYAMIEANDHVMVCLSGGKDSYGLLDSNYDAAPASSTGSLGCNP